ncbi:LGFP repeat-containing protein [Microbacterium sp. ASV49]|uniref:LGFP repeat-containing protein n=1 Tax=Microbacterium candidum TaxID=3041922 RepID=A0ABT7N0W6_9MICO|nr:hypothetical protein [Microbacterium sp. ASV49]MDL9980310.1 hypothetical protein [Microbacterium sp. ASV49]
MSVAVKRARRSVIAVASVSIMTFVVGCLVVLSPATSANAADLSQFVPGNIIDDPVFYDGSAMTSPQIQSFLDQKIGTCQNGQCINILTASISSRAATYSSKTGNLICSAIQGGSMLVSELIYRVQTACGISAKVILVTLQKEQGLVTNKAPSSTKLDAAMGANCPDTAPCDPAYAGIGPQIVTGVAQLKTYRAAQFARQIGTYYIPYSTNSACLGTYLNIANYATAALYNYTPYQPNAASLAAGYGLGDACSTYGNRNFYNYFVDWFGTTRSLGVYGPIKDRYDLLGGAAGYLGKSTSGQICGLSRGGCYQVFEGGLIYLNPQSYAYDVANRMRAGWGPQAEWGWMGYPISGTNCGLTAGGCYQVFEGGTVFWSPATGSHSMSPKIGQKYGTLNAEWGPLGYPVSDVDCGLQGGGCGMNFQQGAIYTSPSGNTSYVAPRMLPGWTDRERGPLGYPISDTICGLANGGCYQTFDKGLIYWSPATGAAAIFGSIPAVYGTNDAEWGWLGYPTSSTRCGLAKGGCAQTFQGASLYWSPATGGYAVRPEVMPAWTPHGAEAGPLGYPTSAPPKGGTNLTYTQTFEGGVVTVTNGVGVLTSATDPWVTAKIASPQLGAALSDVRCGLSQGGCYQVFQHGSIYSSPGTGTFSVRSETIAVWTPHGAESGPLGYPTGNPSSTGSTYTQSFQGGVVTVTNGVAVLTSATDPWITAKIASPQLGAALSDVRCGLSQGGCYQVFQHGSIFSSPGTGTYSVRPEAIAVWAPLGAEWGQMGYPTSNPSSIGSTYTQTFQHGTLTVTSGVAHW